MIVTPCARDRHCLEGLGEDVDLVVDDIQRDPAEPDAIVVAGLSQTIESRADDGLVDIELVIDAGVREQVSGDLLANELIVGNVLVESTDHIVAVAPRADDLVVPLISAGLGEANEVEPVPRPLLAELRRVEEPIDEPLIGVGRGIVDEAADLF